MLLHCNIVIAFYEKCNAGLGVAHVDEELICTGAQAQEGERLKNGELIF